MLHRRTERAPGRERAELAPTTRNVRRGRQSAALSPHRNGYDTSASGRRLGTVAPALLKTKVEGGSAAVGRTGFETRRPAQMSGGQQQRIALARALINRPRMLLADEPTGNLDSKASDNIHELLRQLNREHNQTFILVTHDERMAEKTDRSIRLVDGRSGENSINSG